MTTKKVCVFLVFLTITFSLFAFDYGGNVDFSLLTDTDKSLSETLKADNTIDFWMSFPVDFSGNTIFTFGGLFGYNLSLRNVTNDIVTNPYYDFSTISLRMQIPLDENSVCNYKMGRFDWADSTKNIYNAKIDALSFYFNFTNLNIDLTAGYTGLLNGRTQNNYDTTFVGANNSGLYTKNPSSFIGALTFTSKQGILDFLGFTKLNLETLVNYSFDSVDKSGLYLTGMIANRLSETFAYDIESTFLFPIGTTKFPANFSTATITFGKGKTLTKINGVFASSTDTTPEASLSQFVPISAISIDKKGTILPNSILSVGGEFDFVPSQKFSIQLLADAYFNVASNSQFSFKELQWCANFNLAPVSDFKMTLKAGQSMVKLLNPFYVSFSTTITY